MRYFVLIIILCLSTTVFSEEENDPILEFYKKRAESTYQGRNPITAGVSFSFELTSYYKSIKDNGYTILVDSLVRKYFYSFGQIDSSTTIVKSGKIDDVDISYPNIFSGDYSFFFYPNDTGGSDLSIGYDTYDIDYERPIGFAVIDRNRYFFKWLYMFYISERRDQRHSKWLRFTEHEGFIFPDSIWEFKANRGILSIDHYRIETGIRDITIYR